MIYAVEVLFALVVVVMLITQIIIPAIRGSIMFPLFGKTAEVDEAVQPMVVEEPLPPVVEVAPTPVAKPRKPRAKKPAAPKP